MSATHKPGTVKATLRELKDGTWFGNAQRRASRRKSRWNLLLLLALPLWLFLFFSPVGLSRFVKTLLTHGHTLASDLIWPSSIAPALIWFPLIVATLPLAMVLTNYFVYYCVPPAARAMDAEDKGYPGTDYATQQPILVRITLFVLPPAFVLAVIGQLFL